MAEVAAFREFVSAFGSRLANDLWVADTACTGHGARPELSEYRSRRTCGDLIWGYVPRFVHFGEENCYRVAVLRRSGFTVDLCLSANQLRDALLYRGEANVILITDLGGEISEEILRLIRGCSSAPVVLFRSSSHDYPNDWFDLMIPVLSRPVEWLGDIARLTESTDSASSRTGKFHRDIPLV